MNIFIKLRNFISSGRIHIREIKYKNHIIKIYYDKPRTIVVNDSYRMIKNWGSREPIDKVKAFIDEFLTNCL